MAGFSLIELFDDAHRRVCIAKSKKEDKPRERIWTGLAMPSHIKPGVEQGFFKPVHGETPRVLNWYTFTEKGWEEYDRRYAGKPDWFSAYDGRCHKPD